MLIEGNHVIAEPKKVLKCIWDNQLYGKEVWLGKVYYKDNIKLDTPYELSVEDFEEVDNPEEEVEYEIIDNKIYYFQDKSYDEIKTFIIKLHYSNDDLISIMSNNNEEKIKEMQEWCEYASIIACMCTNDISEKVITIPTTTKVFRMYGFPPDCRIHFLASTPPTICSPMPTRGNFYVGDGSSAAYDDAVRQAYLADSTWSTYSSRLDTWYNYLHP